MAGSESSTWVRRSSPQGESTPRADGTRLRLVIVEDDANERALMVRALQGRGHSCKPFSDGRAAAADIVASPPDVVVSDLNMPGFGGKELCDHLQQCLGSHAPPVVVVSGVSDVDAISEVLEAGALHFVGKPFKVGELVAVVERAARGPMIHPGQSRAAESPEELGGYRVIELLGRGGMSSVYRARSPQTGSEVVLKAMTPSGGQLDTHMRFHREFQLLAQLRSPGLPRVFKCGTDRGRMFIVMEFVRGEGLNARLRLGGALPAHEVASLGIHLANTLAYVHGEGIVHRDVKPSNVILRAEGSPCLIDFGVARHERDLAVTSRFEIVGTPSYCAPELVSPDRISPKVDVFSLGITLYEALLGEHPLLWQMEHVSPLDVLLWYGREGLPDVRRHVPSAPDRIAELLRRMLAPEPEQRPDAADVARELEETLAAV